MRPKKQSRGILPKRRDKIMIGFGKTAVVFLLLAVIAVWAMFLILDTCPWATHATVHFSSRRFWIESRSGVYVMYTEK